MFRRRSRPAPREDGYVPNEDDAELQDLVSHLIEISDGHAGLFGAIHFKHPWTVESGTTADGREWHRYTCKCSVGEWRFNKDHAGQDGERHAMWGEF